MIERRYIRFPADEGDIALITCDEVTDRPALIINEAKVGCALVFVGASVLKMNDSCTLKVGRLPPLLAKVVWVNQVDEELCKVGFEFSE